MRTEYINYIHETNLAGSGKADSYVRALSLIGEMLQIKSFGFNDCKDLWKINSIERITELKELVSREQAKSDESVWLTAGLPPSYLKNGYCKAALSSYAQFLAERSQENNLYDLFEKHKGDAAALSNLLDSSIECAGPKCFQSLLEGIKVKDGEDVIRSVKTRLNQNIFRRMLANIYNDSCCITGINIPTLNRASHILSWANSPSKRLDPSNGLFLSATYDAAFDKNLISLDDKYKIIISKEIKEHYTNQSVVDYFKKKEGQKITLPNEYLPNQTYLAKHRDLGVF